jgi:hypothetical protein
LTFPAFWSIPAFMKNGNKVGTTEWSARDEFEYPYQASDLREARRRGTISAQMKRRDHGKAPKIETVERALRVVSHVLRTYLKKAKAGNAADVSGDDISLRALNSIIESSEELVAVKNPQSYVGYRWNCMVKAVVPLCKLAMIDPKAPGLYLEYRALGQVFDCDANDKVFTECFNPTWIKKRMSNSGAPLAAALDIVGRLNGHTISESSYRNYQKAGTIFGKPLPPPDGFSLEKSVTKRKGKSKKSTTSRRR